jgi:hypothetical protein
LLKVIIKEKLYPHPPIPFFPALPLTPGHGKQFAKEKINNNDSSQYQDKRISFSCGLDKPWKVKRNQKLI